MLNDQFLADTLGQKIISKKPLGGGCTGMSFRVLTEGAIPYFVKTIDSAHSYPNIFLAEARGLRELGLSSCLKLAEPIHADQNVLIIKWIESSPPTDQAYRSFAKSLAAHHLFQAEEIVDQPDNYIGRTPQLNKYLPGQSWAEFFVEKRLHFQWGLLESHHLFSAQFAPFKEKVLSQALLLLDKIDEPCRSYLHGDLWGGNHLMDQRETIHLIDPAFYLGHREADLALIMLFNSYPDFFLDEYQKKWPLSPGYEKRFKVYQLYHALNHVNLEGESYLSLLSNIISCLK